MTDRYQALRDAIAAGPTPGRRYQGRNQHTYVVYDKECWLAPDGSRHGETPNLVIHVSPEDSHADAAFLAAADPDTIRALIEEREALREALESARAGLAWYRDMCPEHVDASDDEVDELIDAALQLGETE